MRAVGWSWRRGRRGELLNRKADEEVAVLVMPWQDMYVDSMSVSFHGNTGLMKTHDEETQRFFEGALCPHNADALLTMVQRVETS
jgi:phospholipase D1/2